MKETFIIIGEGPTEYFFLNSLKDEFRSMQNISPQYPKHTSMAELELIIKNAIEQGYENMQYRLSHLKCHQQILYNQIYT